MQNNPLIKNVDPEEDGAMSADITPPPIGDDPIKPGK